MKNNRLDHELAECVVKWGWKYHHLGIPTDQVMPDERYIPHLKFYVSGFNTSPFGIEWMRFDKDCPLSEVIKSVPHVAFEVNDMDKELARHTFEIISEPGVPSDGVRAAMILHNGAPIELIEFKNSNHVNSAIDPITTDRLIIRLAKPEDAEELYAYRADPIENRYQGWFPESAEEVRKYVTHMPVHIDVADICFQFAIITKNENRLIGDMGIIFTGHEKMQAEIGCTLNKDFQRKGYATEALTAMVHYLFAVLKKHRVVASVDPDNTASIRLIERLGFRNEGHFKESYYLRGQWVDEIMYAMLDKDWSNSQPMQDNYTSL